MVTVAKMLPVQPRCLLPSCWVPGDVANSRLASRIWFWRVKDENCFTDDSVFKWHSPLGCAISTNGLCVCLLSVWDNSEPCHWSTRLSLVIEPCDWSTRLSLVIHLYIKHRVYSWRLGWSTSVRWGSTLSIESFAIFNSTVLPNIWSEQSVCTSLNKNTVTYSKWLMDQSELSR